MTTTDHGASDTIEAAGSGASPDAAAYLERHPAVLVTCVVAVMLCVVAGLWVAVGTSDGAVDPAGAAVATVPTSPVPPTVAPTPTVAPPPAEPPEDMLPVSGWGRRVVYSIARQRVWWVDEDETVLRTSRVSGRLDMPATGVFQVFSKTEDATGLDGSKMDHFVRFTRGPNGGAIGFHDIPEFDGVRVQSDEQLGEPLSHGCIRQREEDSTFTWDFLQVGDNVVVVA